MDKNILGQKGFLNQFVTFEVHDIEDADALGNNPIYNNNEVIGRATGGNYGFRTQKSLMLGMIIPKYAKSGTKLTTDILGKKHSITVIDESPYDPENKLLKA